MKIVTFTNYPAKLLGAKAVIKMIKDAGFDGYDFSFANKRHVDPCVYDDDFIPFIKELRTYADEIGLPCEQCHTIFPTLKPGGVNSDEMYELQVKCLEAASMLGCKIAVIHPGNNCSAEENYEFLYKRLLPVARKLGVKIATENMWNWSKYRTQTYPAACGLAEDFNKHIDMAGDDYLVGCLDIGHAEMRNVQGAPYMIKAMGNKRIRTLHVHDNDLVNDNHTFPFMGRIEWEPILDAFKEIGYDGTFTFECDDAVMSRYPTELFPALFKLLYETGKFMVSKIEN